MGTQLLPAVTCSQPFASRTVGTSNLLLRTAPETIVLHNQLCRHQCFHPHSVDSPSVRLNTVRYAAGGF